MLTEEEVDLIILKAIYKMSVIEKKRIVNESNWVYHLNLKSALVTDIFIVLIIFPRLLKTIKPWFTSWKKSPNTVFLWSVYFCIWNECEYLPYKFPYLVQERGKTDQKNSVFGHLPRTSVKRYKGYKKCTLFSFAGSN